MLDSSLIVGGRRFELGHSYFLSYCRTLEWAIQNVFGVCSRTEAYMAPELFQYGGPRPTTAVDMYSFGVLVWCGACDRPCAAGTK